MTDLVAIFRLVSHVAHVTATSTQNVPQPVQHAFAVQAAKQSGGGGSAFTVVAEPLAWVLAAVYSVIPNYGVAIIGLSIIWMLIISPLTLKSTRSMLAMQKLQPELKKLQAKHKDDRQAFAQAQMDLFREHNVSPFGSCLPMLLPLPVFFALFKLIDGLSTPFHFVYQGTTYTTYTPKFLNQGTQMYKSIVASNGKLPSFGMNLAQSPISHHNGFLAAAPYWIAILVMAGTSYMQTAMMQNRNAAATAANPQMRMMKYFAPVFAIFCVRFPVGVIVYYATSNICRILQQDAMYRFDPKVKGLVAADLAEVEEHTLEIDERERNRPGYTPPRGAKPPAVDKRAVANRPSNKGAGGAPPASGRSKFRDLLAAAAEQAEAKRAADKGGGDPGTAGPTRSAGTGGTPPRSANGGGKGGQSNSNGNGAARPGPNNRPKPQGGRTNRKRRGR